MACIGQGEIGDTHDIKGQQVLPDDDIKIIIGHGGPNAGADGPPVMIMNAWMVVNQKVIMTTVIKYLETQWVDYMNPEYLGVVKDLEDCKD